MYVFGYLPSPFFFYPLLPSLFYIFRVYVRVMETSYYSNCQKKEKKKSGANTW